MRNLTPEELVSLWRSPEFLHLLADYHDEQACMADAVGAYCNNGAEADRLRDLAEAAEKRINEGL